MYVRARWEQQFHRCAPHARPQNRTPHFQQTPHVQSTTKPPRLPTQPKTAHYATLALSRTPHTTFQPDAIGAPGRAIPRGRRPGRGMSRGKWSGKGNTGREMVGERVASDLAVKDVEIVLALLDLPPRTQPSSAVCSLHFPFNSPTTPSHTLTARANACSARRGGIDRGYRLGVGLVSAWYRLGVCRRGQYQVDDAVVAGVALLQPPSLVTPRAQQTPAHTSPQSRTRDQRSAHVPLLSASASIRQMLCELKSTWRKTTVSVQLGPGPCFLFLALVCSGELRPGRSDRPHPPSSGTAPRRRAK
eukprot:2197522-Rhodomonas_salina.1